DVANTTVTLEKCLVLGTAVGLILSGVPIVPVSRAGRLVLLAACGLLFSIIVSIAHATYYVPVAREFFKQAEFLVLFWCAITLMERSPASQRTFPLAVGASALIVATLAASQALFGGAPSGIWVNGHPVPRVAGTLEGPNQLAGYLEAVLPLLWVAPILTAWMKPAWIYTVAACVAALILTQSRAGVFVTAVGYLVYRVVDRVRGNATLMPVIVGAVGGFAIVTAWFIFWAHAGWRDVERLFLFSIPQSTGGVGSRAQLWPAAIELFRRHPLTGVGAGNFEFLLRSVGLAGVQTHAGSLWLQTLAEQGLVGLAGLLVFAIVALRMTWRRRYQSALALPAFLAVGSLLLHQVVDDLFFFPKVAALAWLMLGAGTASVQDRTVRLESGVEPRPDHPQIDIPQRQALPLP
ncbi:MAG TPA: O-antigen ligase family protein, partial [Candidatus Baltobacteraceae bacterium]|nr:O-antigen ligase family protein [Candidatus Baltobacteraceae bacterium]